MAYLTLVNETVSRGQDPRNGAQIVQMIKGRMFEGKNQKYYRNNLLENVYFKLSIIVCVPKHHAKWGM